MSGKIEEEELKKLLSGDCHEFKIEMRSSSHPHIDWDFPSLPQIKIYCDSECCQDYILHWGEECCFGAMTGLKIPRANFWNKIALKEAYFTCKQCDNHVLMIFEIIPDGHDGSFAKASFRKIFQFPRETVIPKEISKFLDQKTRKLYKFALLEESAGHGIGAMAYYRRIIENIWKDILDEVISLLDPIKNKKSIEFYQNNRSSWRFEQSVKDSKLVVPPSLIIDNNNLLLILHKNLSVGIHYLDDQEALKKAKEIKIVLNTLLKRFFDLKQDHTEIKKAIVKLTK